MGPSPSKSKVTGTQARDAFRIDLMTETATKRLTGGSVQSVDMLGRTVWDFITLLRRARTLKLLNGLFLEFSMDYFLTVVHLKRNHRQGGEGLLYLKTLLLTL